MIKPSDSFEILISRIHELLEGEGATVTWNDKIPDPDNPTQLRQLDVAIKKGNMTTLIECRLHKEKQNVKWIEELIGRRISLNFDTIIAVSKSGFTSGAIAKANKYGVVLRDIGSLNEDEIKYWARSISICLLFYRYENFKLRFIFNANDINRINIKTLQKELGKYIGFRSLFTPQLELLESKKLILPENRNKSAHFKVSFIIEKFELCGCEVKEIESEGTAFLEKIDLKIPKVLTYGDPFTKNSERNVIIQEFDLGNTRVIHNEGKVSFTLDLSRLDIPAYWQFRYIDTQSNYANYWEKFELLGAEKIIMKVDKVNLEIMEKF